MGCCTGISALNASHGATRTGAIHAAGTLTVVVPCDRSHPSHPKTSKPSTVPFSQIAFTRAPSVNQTHLPHPLGSSLSFGVCGGQHHFKEGVCKPVEKCPSGFSLLLAQNSTRGNLLKQMPDFQGTRSEAPNQTQNAERDPVKPSSASARSRRALSHF